MHNLKIFRYFISNIHNEVCEDSDLWNDPIPVDRKYSKTDTGSVTYKDYFYSARIFFEQDNFKRVIYIIKQHGDLLIDQKDIIGIYVFLVKHGEFYHPAKVEIKTKKKSIFFILNIAISNIGKHIIEKEYDLLKTLNRDLPSSFLPDVYFFDQISLNDHFAISIFAGEFFEDFHEFHFSLNYADTPNKDEIKNQKIVVWDSKNGNIYLSDDQTVELYTQASIILTHFYNINSFEQIFPWHHASGDFVIKINDNTVELKLITVRNYASMLNLSDIDELNDEMIIEAMLIFFLNLSIRMRLDRIDGIGEIGWADELSIKGIAKGFFQALSLKQVKLFGRPVDICFKDYFTNHSIDQLYEIALSIIASYNQLSPDIPVIKKYLREHIEKLFAMIWSHK